MASNTFSPNSIVTGTSGVDGTNKDRIVQVGALQVGEVLITEDEASTLEASAAAAEDLALIASNENASLVGFATDAGGVAPVIARTGNFFTLTFTLDALRVHITDAGGSGSYGAQSLFTFADRASFVHLSQQVYATVTENPAVVFTADVDGTTAVLTNVSSFTDLYVGRSITGTGIAASSEIEEMDEEAGTITLSELTTVLGEEVELTQPAMTGATDGDFEIGLGTTEIVAAADGVLAAGNENIGADVDVVAEVVAPGGTDTTAEYVAAEAEVFLNVSGTAATIDTMGHVDISGTIVVVGVMLA